MRREPPRPGGPDGSLKRDRFEGATLASRCPRVGPSRVLTFAAKESADPKETEPFLSQGKYRAELSGAGGARVDWSDDES